MIYNILVVFLLVFCFPFVGPINSAYIAVFMALLKLLCTQRTSRFFTLYKNNYIKILLWSTLGVTFMCALWTFVLGANDYTLTKAFFSLFVGVVMAILVVSSLDVPSCSQDFYESLIVNVFVVQALISIAAFASPAIREIIHNFQFANEAEKSEESYSGIRGMAVSGRLYFEFAATCGLVSFVQFKRIINYDNPSFIEMGKLFLIVICGFFAGRTSMIGLAFGFLYLFLYKGSVHRKAHIIYRFAITLIASTFVVILVTPSDILLFIMDRFIPWAFDLFIKYYESGNSQNSASFNSLNEMYKYVNITTDEWIHGSGFYMDRYGGYYKSVDGGYIRHILYWGVFGSIISIGYSLFYFIKPYFKCHTRNDRLYIFLVLAYTLLIHYKGDLAPTSRFYHVPLIFLMLGYVFSPLISFFKNKTIEYAR